MSFLSLFSGLSKRASCSMLSLGSVNILFDCGVDDLLLEDPLSPTSNLQIVYSFLQDLVQSGKKIDYIFASDCSLMSIGLLPLVYKFFPEAEVYATTPVAKIGYFLTLDYYSSVASVRNFDLFNEEDIHSFFDHTEEINYYSDISLMNGDIVVLGLPNGYSIGSVSWKIKHLLKELVYAPSFSLELRSNSKPINIEEIRSCYTLITNSENFMDISEEASANSIVDAKHLSLTIFNSHIYKRMFDIRKHLFFPVESIVHAFELISLLKEVIRHGLDIFKQNKRAALETDKVGTTFSGNKNFYVLLVGTFANEIYESFKSLTNWVPVKQKSANENMKEAERTEAVPSDTNLQIKALNSYQLLITYLRGLYEQFFAPKEGSNNNNDPFFNSKNSFISDFKRIVDIFHTQSIHITIIPLGTSLINISEWDNLLKYTLTSENFEYIFTSSFNSGANFNYRSYMLDVLESSRLKEDLKLKFYIRHKIEEVPIITDPIAIEEITATDKKADEKVEVVKKDYCVRTRVNRKFLLFPGRPKSELEEIAQFGIKLQTDEKSIIKDNQQLQEVETKQTEKQTNELDLKKKIFYKSEYFPQVSQYVIRAGISYKELYINRLDSFSMLNFIRMVRPKYTIAVGESQYTSLIKQQITEITSLKNCDFYPNIENMSKYFFGYYKTNMQYEYIESSNARIASEIENQHSISVNYLNIKRKPEEIKVCSKEEIFVSSSRLQNVASVGNADIKPKSVYNKFPSYLIFQLNLDDAQNVSKKLTKSGQKLKVLSNSEVELNDGTRIQCDRNTKEVTINSSFGLDYFKIRSALSNS